jgi:chromosome segregation ATPase
MDGQIIIRDDKKSTTDNSNNNSQQFELLRTENERLRAELTSQKTEITVLRGERDSLMHTITKLDIELTQAEYQRASQQQQQQQQKPRKK